MAAKIYTQHYNVQGVRCARCIHAIESALQSEDSVTNARVNMSTNRLSVSWAGGEELCETLAQKVESLGYQLTPYHTPEDQPKSEDKILLRYMAIAGFAMGNIMLISFALWSTDIQAMGLATRELMHWISALIALPTITYAGQPFFNSALSVIKHGRTNMDVPISLALILASGMSVFESYHGGEHAYFDSAVMLLFFLLIGRWLDARARGKARENAHKLLSLMQGYATVIENGTTKKMRTSSLKEGDIIRVVAGERIPTDVELIGGESEVDTSLVTGETVPKAIQYGDILYGGSVNLLNPIKAKVVKASEDSLLADIIRLMEQAEQGRANYVRLADKAAALYTPVVHTLAAAAFLGWFYLGGLAWQEALLIAITTLIITCPCALGLAVPVVQVLASSWLMKRGIMLKSGDALERLAQIDTLICDKTGTLTLGRPALVDPSNDEYLQTAASLATHSKHPYSQAISDAYTGSLLDVVNVREIAAQGIQGDIDGESYFLGKPKQEPIDTNSDTHSQIALYKGDEQLQLFSLADPIRSDSADIVQAFKGEHIATHILSGDRELTTQALANKLGITNAKGNLLPQDKTAFIKILQERGQKALMVGDGLNDAPSLTQANVSMSPATGMDITQNSADIIFQGDKLVPLWQSWRIAQLSTKLVKQNFALAVMYNLIAIPLAVAGYVTPIIAAIAMSSSSLLVVANSFRLNRMKD